MTIISVLLTLIKLRKYEYIIKESDNGFKMTETT